MSGELLTVIIVVGTALAFDFTNGFHDTANVVATSISTRAMAPRLAVAYASLLNFVGAFISLEVAATVAKDVVDPSEVTLLVVFGVLIGAIAWILQDFKVRPGWSGGNPVPDPPWVHKGLLDPNGNLKPVYALTQEMYKKTKPLVKPR